MQINGWFGHWQIWILLVATTAGLWLVMLGMLFLAQKCDTFLDARLWRKLGMFLLAFLFFASCGFPAWRDRALRDVTEGRWHVNPEQIPTGSAPSQSIEFYDAGGKHVGYGKVQGGTAEFFNADGSRVGFGRR